MVQRLAAGLSGEALDYGCGWGDLTARLAPQFSAIAGVDTDPERVAFAAAEYAPIRFDVCGPEGVACPDAAFDVVFSTVVLHFVPDPDDYLRECARLLRPGGHLVITIPNPDSMWMVGSRMLGRGRYRAAWGGASAEEFPGFLLRHGWTVQQHDGFYDPPFDRVRNVGDVALSLMNGVGHALGWQRHSSYSGFRARRDG